MPRLTSQARKKIRIARRRIQNAVIREIKKSIAQQRKWKARVMNSRQVSK